MIASNVYDHNHKYLDLIVIVMDLCIFIKGTLAYLKDFLLIIPKRSSSFFPHSKIFQFFQSN